MDPQTERLPEIDLAATPPPRPAGFWLRALALFLDYVFLLIVIGFAHAISGVIWGEAGRSSRVLSAATTAFRWMLPPLYAVLFHWLWGQTMGKMLVGARVVSAEGGPLSLRRAVGRALAWLLAALPLGAGLLVAGLRRDRRGLHDLLAGTRVERA